jgi:hypothetical protein
LLLHPAGKPTYYVKFVDDLGDTLGTFVAQEGDLIPQTGATGRNIGQV